jgi:hypothetical protein
MIRNSLNAKKYFMEDKKMKFTKTLASIAAAAIAVSSLAVSAFAADINLGKELNADELALLKDTDTTFVVEYDSPNGWDDIGFGASIDEIGTWASANFKAEVGKGTLTVTVADILKKMGIESLADASYMKVEGYNETTISKVEIKAADAEKPAEPKPIQTKADISFTDKKTPSYTYTVKGDIDTLKVDVALSADAAAAQAGWNDWCSAGVAVKNPDGTVKYYQWGGASVNWSWDVDGDNVGETGDGVGTETWIGTVGADGGQISIPVVKGAVVDFYCLSWDTYNGVQYTLTINDEEAAVEPGETEEPTKPGETEDPAEPVAPADVKIANSGRTVIDSGLVRTNIINEWTGNDADVIADKAAFAGANKISVKFTVTNFTTPFKAWIAMADSKWECQFQGEGDKRNANAKCTPVEVTGNGTYVVTIDLDKVIDGVAFISVCTDLKAADGDAIPTIAIDQIKINEEITVKPGEPADPTKPGESDPTKPGESDPVKPGESDPVKPGDCSGEPVNPPTGAAVAVIPAALAAAAVATTGIVLKKRSK